MKKKVRIICNEDVNITEISGMKNEVTVKYKIKNSLTAPVSYRQSTGTVSIYLNGKHVKDVDAVSEELVKKDNRKTLKRSAGLIFSEFVKQRLY